MTAELHDDLLLLRQSALLEYFNYNEGIKAKQNLLNSYIIKQHENNSKYQKDYDDYIKLIELNYDIKYHLYYEEIIERKQHIRLLRDRVWNCAMGYQTSCDYFNPTWLPEDTYPSLNLPKEVKYNNITKCNWLTERSNKNLQGTARIYSVCCDAPYLLPSEENERNLYKRAPFRTLYDYIKYINSPAGQNARNTMSANDLREDTLFGPYLERGTRGHQEGVVIMIDFIGILLSPLYFAISGVYILINKLFHSTMWSYVYSSIQHTTHTLVNYSSITTSLLPPLPPYITPPSYLHTLNTHIQEFLHYTTSINYSTLLDPSRYSPIMSILEYIHPLPFIHMFIYTILLHQPLYYYQYYMTNYRSRLPQRVSACLLRSGVIQSNVEIRRFEESLSTYDRYIEYKSKLSSNRNKLSTITPLIKNVSTNNLHDTTTNHVSETLKTLKIRFPAHSIIDLTTPNQAQSSTDAVEPDYGVKNEWEAVKDICLTYNTTADATTGTTNTNTDNSTTLPAYTNDTHDDTTIPPLTNTMVYKLCLFQGVYINDTLIAPYRHWIRTNSSSSSSGSGSSDSVESEDNGEEVAQHVLPQYDAYWPRISNSTADALSDIHTSSSNNKCSAYDNTMSYSRVFNIYYTLISALFTSCLKYILYTAYTNSNSISSSSSNITKSMITDSDYCSYQIYTSHSTISQKGHNSDPFSVVILVRFICSREHKIDNVRHRPSVSDDESKVRFIYTLIYHDILTIMCWY